MTILRRLPVAVPIGLLAAVLAGCLPAIAGDDPLTVQQIVRDWVAGSSEKTLLARIEAGPLDTSYDDEMLEELSHAGLPVAVIAALRDARDEAGPPAVAGSADVVQVRLTVEGGKKRRGDRESEQPDDATETPSDETGDAPATPPPPTLSVPAAIPGQVARVLSLPPGVEESTDLAIFVADLTTDHVPDQWRAHTPLGRDVITMPRHRMLAFHHGAERVGGNAEKDAERAAKSDGRAPRKSNLREMFGAGRTRARLELAVPEALEVELSGGAPYRLMLGIALLIDGRWLLVGGGELPEFTPGEAVLTGILRQARGNAAPTATLAVADPPAAVPPAG